MRKIRSLESFIQLCVRLTKKLDFVIDEYEDDPDQPARDKRVVCYGQVAVKRQNITWVAFVIR